MKTQIFKTYKEFTERKDKAINGVTPTFADKYPEWKSMNKTNTSCWCCIYCHNCNYCNHCDNCNSCNYCYSCDNLNYRHGLIGAKA